jgi:HlyD family secretion protein
MKKLLLILVTAALLSGCAQANSSAPSATPTASAVTVESKTSNATGYVTPIRHADLAFRMGGRVTEVLVKEGNQVKAGQSLVKLDDAELKAGLLQAQADLAHWQAGARTEEIAVAQANVAIADAQVKAAQVELDNAQNGTVQAADVASAQAQVAQAKAQLKAVQDAYDSIMSGIETLKQYGRSGSTLSRVAEQTRVQIEAVQAAYSAAQKQLTLASTSKGDDVRTAQARLDIALGQQKAAQAQLDLVKAGSTQEQIDAAQARVTQAQAALDETTLVAPFDGTIAELTVNVGEMIGPGARVASLADFSQWQVETDDLNETDVVNVSPNAPATITVDALPDVSLNGQVKSIVPRSTVKRGDVTYTTKVIITDPDPRLKWGMTASVDISRQPNTAITTAPVAATKTISSSNEGIIGYVTPIRHADLALSTNGRVEQVLVTEGDQIKAGQPLIQLEATSLKAALAQAQADLKSLQNGARPEEIAAAQANLDIAQSQLELAQAELNRLQNGALTVPIAAAQADAARAQAELKVAQDSYDALVLGPGHGVADDLNVPGRGLGAYEEQKRAQLAATQAAYNAALKRVTEAQVGMKNSLQAAQAGVDVAIAQRDAAKARSDLIKAGAISQQIDLAKARVQQAQAALDEATLAAPFDGTIAEVTINPGEIAAPGMRLISLADVTQWEVDTDDLTEKDVVGVQPGAPVNITLDALPGVTLKGQVMSITPRSTTKSGDVTYTVKISIADPDPRLRWGMTASVDILNK